MKFRLALILIVLFITTNSCQKIQHKDRIKEGYIEYNIEYLDDSLDSFMVGLLPKKMTVKFKNNNTINKIEGFSGIVSFTHIQNYRDHKNITLVKILNKRYKYVEKLNDKSLFFEELPGMEIEFEDSIKQVCGYNAKKALITVPESDIKPFEIFYTNDVIINNVNALTPFRAIDGVLLEFQIKFYDMNMKLTVDKIQAAEVSSDEFDVPKGYDPINRNTMIEIIELLKN
jgi:GLPGLI family protein